MKDPTVMVKKGESCVNILHQGPKEYINRKKKTTPLRNGQNEDVISVKMYIIILVLTSIPIVNLITMLILVFSVENQNLRNFGIASLFIAVFTAITIWLWNLL